MNLDKDIRKIQIENEKAIKKEIDGLNDELNNARKLEVLTSNELFNYDVLLYEKQNKIYWNQEDRKNYIDKAFSDKHQSFVSMFSAIIVLPIVAVPTGIALGFSGLGAGFVIAGVACAIDVAFAEWAFRAVSYPYNKIKSRFEKTELEKISATRTLIEKITSKENVSQNLERKINKLKQQLSNKQIQTSDLQAGRV